jgi:transcriptional regulator with XRE-family HTH domain
MRNVTAAQLLRRARAEARLTQRDVARIGDVPQATVARVERGTVSPRVDTLERLLAACGYRLALAPRPGAAVDRTVIRELLALTPAERLARAEVEANELDALLSRART